MKCKWILLYSCTVENIFFTIWGRRKPDSNSEGNECSEHDFIKQQVQKVLL